MTIWHLLSAVCLIAATVSASATAKSQHVSLWVYAVCILTGILIGVATALGNLACARAVAKVIGNRGTPLKIAILSLLVAASICWMILADMSGQWAALAVSRAAR
jgi:hypothetical protein